MCGYDPTERQHGKKRNPADRWTQHPVGSEVARTQTRLGCACCDDMIAFDFMKSRWSSSWEGKMFFFFFMIFRLSLEVGRSYPNMVVCLMMIAFDFEPITTATLRMAQRVLAPCPLFFFQRRFVKKTTLCRPFRSVIYLFTYFSDCYFPGSGQTTVTGVVPSLPRFLPSIFIAHRVQQSHCSSIFHRV